MRKLNQGEGSNTWPLPAQAQKEIPENIAKQKDSTPFPTWTCILSQIDTVGSLTTDHPSN
jgi:hypothetical protein